MKNLSVVAGFAAILVIAPVFAVAQDGGIRFNWEIGFGNVVTLIAFVVGGIWTYFDIRSRSIANSSAIVDARAVAAEATAQLRAWATHEIDEAKEEAAEAKIRAEAAHLALNEFRVKVASDYASKELIREVMAGITAEIHRLGDRMDRWHDKTE